MSSVAIPLTVITNLDIRNNFSIFAIANEYNRYYKFGYS